MAVEAFLEMKNIKKMYMLEDIDESDDEFSDLNIYEDNTDLLELNYNLEEK